MMKALARAGVVVGALLAGSAAANAQADPGLTDDTIKVGIIGPFSGPASEFSKSQVGALAYIKSINEAGGIAGRKIETVVEDDGCDEAKGIAAARKLIYDAKVFMLAASYTCSGPGLAAKPVIVESGVPWMIGGAASADLSSPVASTVFHPTATTVDVGHAIIRFALTKPGVDPKKIAVISHSNEWAKGYYEGALAELKDAHGATPVLDLTMERQSTNATPQILKLREARPDVIVALLYPAEMSIFLRDAKKLGVTTAIVTGYGTTVEDQLRRTGDAAAVKNLYAAYLLAHAVDSPAMTKWHEMIHAYAPKEEVTSSGFPGIGGTIVLVETMKKIGRDLTRAKLVEALNHTDMDTGLMAGRTMFTPTDHAGQKVLSFAGMVDGKVTVFTSWGKAAD